MQFIINRRQALPPERRNYVAGAKGFRRFAVEMGKGFERPFAMTTRCAEVDDVDWRAGVATTDGARGFAIDIEVQAGRVAVRVRPRPVDGDM